MTLWQDFMTHDGKLVHKNAHYFPIYERHFAPWRNRSVTFLEIGVARGGSLALWQRFFGPLSKIIGIDILEKRSKAAEAPGIFVRIGDQSDENFLQSIIDEFGVPDVVLDDGSHQMEHIVKTFNFLYPKMPKNSIYLVEDLHTAYWKEYGGGVDNPDTFINLTKKFIDRLNADNSRGEVPTDFITQETFGISFYSSVVVLEKGDVYRKETLRSGRKRLADRLL
jgi:cephalosporin hydroxylase